MVDKKLSEFSQITPAEIAKLICLYLDENNAIKNGVVDFATLNNLIVHKSDTEEITGDKTFSGDAVFSGDTTFNKAINGTCSRATADGDGNNISSTYSKLSGSNRFTGRNEFANSVYTVLDAILGTAPQTKKEASFGSIDNNGTWIGGDLIVYNSDGSISRRIDVKRQDGTENYASFDVGFDSNQNDYANASPGVKQTIVGWGMPDYDSGVSLNYTSGTINTFTAQYDCLVILNSFTNSGGSCNAIFFKQNNSGDYYIRSDIVSSTGRITSCQMVVPKGFTVYPCVTGDTFVCAYYPLKGVSNA